METWLLELLLLSAKASGVILLVLAIRWVLGTRIPIAMHYALWSLVLMRLALPVFPASPFSLFNLANVDPLAERIPGLGPLTLPDGVSGVAPQLGSSGNGALLSWPQLAVSIWLGGVVLLLAHRLVLQRRLQRRITQARPVQDPQMLSLLDECKAAVGVTAAVELRQAPGLPGPAIVGLSKAKILLPEDLPRRLERQELRHVLLHELTHLRRRDGLIRGISRTLALLHWFNPCVHFGLRRMEMDCELACDDAVLRRLPAKERSAYGHTLLFLTTAARPLPAGLGIGMSAKRQLKRRIEMIARFQPSGRSGLFLGLGTFVLVAVMALTDVPVLAGAASSGGRDAGTAGAASDDHLADLNRAKVTVARTREIGTAMWTYYTDACSKGRCEPPEGVETTEDKPAPKGFVSWSNCPTISFEELEAKLVPAYLPELPHFDGFGNRFEFCFRPDEKLYIGHAIAGIRSPGLDGIYEGDTYTVGAFHADEVDKDLFWQDGYFLTWPSRK